MTCYFRPHYAFKSVKGQSLKYQCWHLQPDRTFYGKDGEKLDVGEVKVVIEKDKGGENRSHLYAKSDTANAKEIKPDRIKVKYLDAAPPNHDTRYNEAFTEIAASRIMWALGFPADHEYPSTAAACVGCSSDPFKSDQKDNKAGLHDTPVSFPIATIGRETPWDEIDPENDETWSWRDVASFYSSGRFTRQQKVQYDAYRMALGLFTYHNAIDVQNRLSCAEWKEGADNPKICTKPMVFVQDLGSTFGKPKSFLGANPRGKYSAWKTQSVFSNVGACELKYRPRWRQSAAQGGTGSPHSATRQAGSREGQGHLPERAIPADGPGAVEALRGRAGLRTSTTRRSTSGPTR